MSDLALSTLTRAIATLPDGYYVTADTVREAFDAAQLTSAERGGAFRTACTVGLLRPVTVLIPGHLQPVHVDVPTTHEAGKGRRVLLYRRTPKRVAA
jgi:hypothetical protein